MAVSLIGWQATAAFPDTPVTLPDTTEARHDTTVARHDTTAIYPLSRDASVRMD